MAVLNFPASPSNGDTYDNFVYDATKGAWKLQTLLGNDLDNLNDVDATTPTDGDYLAYNDSTGNWEPLTPPEIPSPIGLILALGG
jgi:hypothetical protein